MYVLIYKYWIWNSFNVLLPLIYKLHACGFSVMLTSSITISYSPNLVVKEQILNDFYLSF